MILSPAAQQLLLATAVILFHQAAVYFRKHRHNGKRWVRHAGPYYYYPRTCVVDALVPRVWTKYQEETFTAALRYVKSSGAGNPLNLTDDQRLEFYKYYKQATEGDCCKPAPGFFSFEEKAKHKAWVSVKNMSKEEAQRKYIEALDRATPQWRQTPAP
ncbi:UNVERIFIED_CONTAM: hypothetical protein H355_001938 [Colinus virginianus]|nr:hypothetical protein H355_001938 [Colinus virginianus]